MPSGWPVKRPIREPFTSGLRVVARSAWRGRCAAAGFGCGSCHAPLRPWSKAADWDPLGDAP
eukprot:3549339-Pleurochrysis_carterae.AAC.2